MKLAKTFIAVAALAASTAIAQQEPWKGSELVQPEALAARLTDSSHPKPALLFIGFPVLYHGAHIPGALMVGPASKPDGLDAMKQAVSKLPHDAEIVIYCGCCPFDHCPNVRPAFAELRKMGFTNVSLLSIPTNMSKDWVAKGYPVEKGK